MQLCGRLVIELDGSRVETALPGKQGRLLFAYLALNPGRPVPRDELMTALWSGPVPPAASSSLSAVLSRLRKVLGADRLTGRDECELHLPEDTLVDVRSALRFAHLAESMLAAGRNAEAWWAAAPAMYIGGRPLLPGHEGDWIDEWRRLLTDARQRAVEVYATASLRIGGGEIVQAVRLSQELVAMSPYHESGYRLLMESLAAQGNIAEALRVYEDLRSRLADELGADPSPATKSLHHRLLLIDLEPGR